MQESVSMLVRVDALEVGIPADGKPSVPVSVPGDPLDDEIIASLRELPGDGYDDLLSELIDLFVSDAPLRLAEIRRALVVGDAKTVICVAHGLKGSSANLGAHRMAGLCGELERQGRTGGLERLAALPDQIEREFHRVRQALEWERQRAAVGEGR